MGHVVLWRYDGGLARASVRSVDGPSKTPSPAPHSEDGNEQTGVRQRWWLEITLQYPVPDIGLDHRWTRRAKPPFCLGLRFALHDPPIHTNRSFQVMRSCPISWSSHPSVTWAWRCTRCTSFPHCPTWVCELAQGSFLEYRSIVSARDRAQAGRSLTPVRLCSIVHPSRSAMPHWYLHLLQLKPGPLPPCSKQGTSGRIVPNTL